MKCKKCGAELSENSKFCSYCGNQVEETIENNTTQDNLDSKNNTKFVNKGFKINDLKEKGSDVFDQFKTKIDSNNNFKTKSKNSSTSNATQLTDFVKKNIKWVVIGLVAIIALFVIVGSRPDYGDAEKYDWNSIVLKTELPQPISDLAEINSNSESYLSMDIYKTSLDEYKAYILECKNKGFIIDVEEKELRFKGYNGAGYKLSIAYYEEDEMMDLTLDEPIELNDLEWPENEFTKLLPKPSSTKGHKIWNDEERFSTYVGDMTYEAYKNYIELCKSNGFNIDVNDSDKNFTAYNEQKYKLTVEYVGANVITISVKVPEYKVSLKVECSENLIFSKYDVDLFIDNDEEDTILHGGQEEYDLTLKRGTHKIKFVSTEDETDVGEIEFDVVSDGEIVLKISCHYDSISVKVKTNTTGKTNDKNENSNENETDNKVDMITSNVSSEDLISKNIDDVKSTLSTLGFTNIKTYSEKTKDESKSNQVYKIYIEVDGQKVTISKDQQYSKDAKISIDYYKYEKPASVSYSTNDAETVKLGNQGVYSYKSTGGSYDVYWIIDFDDGYVYNFTEGNGDDTCTRFRIKSGTLNDSLKICYDKTGDGTAWYVHFNYENSPSKLIVNDHYDNRYEFLPTTLTSALSKMNSKRMIDA